MSDITQSQGSGTAKSGILAFDHIELYVSDPAKTAQYFENSFGFDTLLRSAPADFDSALLLGQGDMRILVSNYTRQAAAASHIARHGDSVKDIALMVDNVDGTYNQAIRNGAMPVEEPHDVSAGPHTIRLATVGTPADLVHTLIKRDEALLLLPRSGSIQATDGVPPSKYGIRSIDHVALAVEQGRLDEWREYYQSAFGFHVTHEEITRTELTAMRSLVMENPMRTVKLPIMEPAEGKKQSQIRDFLINHQGAGVQHVAILCDDIGVAIAGLRAAAVRFLEIPDTYYEMLPSRVRESNDYMAMLRSSRALLDKDEWGILLQTFSKPVFGRATLFFEFVQRKGAKGFGSGNVRALFEAIEREQAFQAMEKGARTR
jgi:4-hydroxyphenylpyruvate dioxygenase